MIHSTVELALAAAHQAGAEEMRERAAQVAMRPRIHDAMRGIVLTPDFGPEIATEIRSLPTSHEKGEEEG